MYIGISLNGDSHMVDFFFINKKALTAVGTSNQIKFANSYVF